MESSAIMYNICYPLRNKFPREADMNQPDVMDDYSRRYQFAKICQYLAVPLLLASLSCLWLSGGAFHTFGEKILLIAGGGLLIAFLALVVLSVDRYRCPNCFKSLGVVRTIKYCPYCGIKLQTADESDQGYSLKAPDEGRGFFGGIGANILPSGGFSRRAATGILPQGNIRPTASDFPEETYPKNIRMFTTSDEMELTKRYIRLIAKDETPPADGSAAAVFDGSSGSERNADPDGTESSPRWRNKEKRKLI